MHPPQSSRLEAREYPVAARMDLGLSHSRRDRHFHRNPTQGHSFPLALSNTTSLGGHPSQFSAQTLPHRHCPLLSCRRSNIPSKMNRQKTDYHSVPQFVRSKQGKPTTLHPALI